MPCQALSDKVRVTSSHRSTALTLAESILGSVSREDTGARPPLSALEEGGSAPLTEGSLSSALAAA